MRFLGVRVDAQRAHTLKQQLTSQEEELLHQIKKETGVEVQLRAARSVAKVFDKLGLPYERTAKSQAPSFTKNFISNHAHPVVRMIAKARECDKANGAFVEGLLNFVHNGRIHADINQIRSDQGGTVTGRFSMSNPNLQQIPAKGYIGKKMRELFVPEENCEWASFDYSQQEPRIVVHYALKLELSGTEDLQKEFNKEDADFNSHVWVSYGIRNIVFI